MKNKILATGALAMIFVIAGNAHAVGQSNGNETVTEVQEQTQTVNQGEDSQIKTQNSEQVGNDDGTNQEDFGSEYQTQQQIQAEKELQNINEEGEQIQNHEQEKIQAQDGSGSIIAQQRKSRVANAVQEMLQVADRNSGVGQQLKIVAQSQTQNHEKLEVSLQKVQSRSGLVKFFIGPNYGEINNAKKTLEQNREQIEQLNQVKNQLANEGDQQILTEQIQLLEQANLEIENSLGISEKGFSLFGWMFRMFSK